MSTAGGWKVAVVEVQQRALERPGGRALLGEDRGEPAAVGQPVVDVQEQKQASVPTSPNDCTTAPAGARSASWWYSVGVARLPEIVVSVQGRPTRKTPVAATVAAEITTNVIRSDGRGAAIAPSIVSAPIAGP